MKQIESKKEIIIRFIENTIRKENSTLPICSSSKFRIPELDEVFILELSKPNPRNETCLTLYRNAIVEPIFYTQREHYKLGETIFEKLPQMVPGMINVLVCATASNTHERDDLVDAIRSIKTLIKENDADFFLRKGFDGIPDFLDHVKYLSGILFKGIWFNASQPSNLLWCNAQAKHQIPDDLQAYLRMMGCCSNAS